MFYRRQLKPENARATIQAALAQPREPQENNPPESRARAIDTPARTLWGEARGEPDQGLQFL